MKKQIIPVILGMAFSILAFNINFDSNSKHGGLSVLSLIKQSHAFGESTVVRFPVAKLCPSKTKYKTECEGSGEGCDPTDC